MKHKTDIMGVKVNKVAGETITNVCIPKSWAIRHTIPQTKVADTHKIYPPQFKVENNINLLFAVFLFNG